MGDGIFEMGNNEDQLAAMKAAVDQGIAASGEMARAMGAYYKELTSQGIPDDVATALLVNFQSLLLMQGATEE